jgi:hypothetical protein
MKSLRWQKRLRIAFIMDKAQTNQQNRTSRNTKSNSQLPDGALSIELMRGDDPMKEELEEL